VDREKYKIFNDPRSRHENQYRVKELPAFVEQSPFFKLPAYQQGLKENINIRVHHGVPMQHLNKV